MMMDGALEHRLELRLIQGTAIDAGHNLYAACAQHIDGAIHFLQRGRHIVHRQRGHKARELLRPAFDHGGHFIVGDTRQHR